MTTNRIYEATGTLIEVSVGAGSTVAFTPQNEGTGKGRKSAQIDFGASPRAARATFLARTKWAATPAANDPVRMYIAWSEDGTNYDGNYAAGDAEITAETEAVNNCAYLGQILAEAADQAYQVSGQFTIRARYAILLWWNGSATKALTNTAADHWFRIYPKADDVQAAA